MDLHTISVPRVRRADDIDPDVFDNGISDETFAKIVACIRIAVPYTGMIVSTRETKETESAYWNLVFPRSVAAPEPVSVAMLSRKQRSDNSAQFDVSDNRTLDEVVKWLMDMGYVPSFCTACYREGRTGDRFMSLLKSKQIVNCCHPNALMTLKEYLEDYASPETKEVGEALIKKELEVITNPKVKEKATEYIEKIHEGNRDFRF